MKKIILLAIILNISLNGFSQKIISAENPLKDTTVIHQISFSRNGNPGYDYKDLLEKELYTIIIEENGVTLKWNGKCPTSKNNTVICSYSGIITKNQFSNLSKKLKQIKYTELKELYVPLVEYEHTTSDCYFITYNNGLQKKITDQNHDIGGLKEFRVMLIKLKKEIKWAPAK